jgi:hypothetical protein
MREIPWRKGPFDWLTGKSRNSEPGAAMSVFKLCERHWNQRRNHTSTELLLPPTMVLSSVCVPHQQDTKIPAHKPHRASPASTAPKHGRNDPTTRPTNPPLAQSTGALATTAVDIVYSTNDSIATRSGKTSTVLMSRQLRDCTSLPSSFLPYNLSLSYLRGSETRLEK